MMKIFTFCHPRFREDDRLGKAKKWLCNILISFIKILFSYKSDRG